MAQHVLVLNATYEPLNVCSVRRACVLLLKDKAEIVEILDRPIHSSTRAYPRPTVIRLVSYVRVPRSKGGGSSWENIVTSCAPCNLRKADRLPHEAGMVPKTHPRAPAPGIFITLAAPEVPASWELYLNQMRSSNATSVPG